MSSQLVDRSPSIASRLPGLARQVAAAALTLLSSWPAAGSEVLRATAVGQPLAVLTEVTGGVGVTAGGERRPARPPVALADGDRLRLGAGARAVLVCRGDRLVTLHRSRRIAPGVCSHGRALPPGSFAVVLPGAGRARRVAGTEVPLEPGSHRDLLEEYGRLPVVLSPRATAVATARPSIRWTAVPDADLYLVEWLGSSAAAIEIVPDRLPCYPDPELDGDIVSCVLPWPESHPPLQTGADYGLRVYARPRDRSGHRVSREANRVRVLPADMARRLDDTMADLAIAAPQVGELSVLLIRAGILLHYGLASEAVSSYGRAARLEPSAKILVTLGDAYRAVRLFRFARESYVEAAAAAETAAERAAVAAGLGHVSYAWGRFDEAAAHFSRAERLFRLARSPIEAGEAARARDAAELRRPSHGRESGGR